MREELIMPRWAQVGTQVSQVHYYNSAGIGSPYSEGRSGKIVRVLKTQVEVEFPMHRQEDPNATTLTKFRLVRGYRPFGEGNVRVDSLEEMGSKWRTDVIWPTEGKQIAYLRIKKDLLRNASQMQAVTLEFGKKNQHHIHMADIAELMTKLHEKVEERKALEERLLEIDEMPQDR